MADLVDEVKSRIGIEELVSQYVQLKKAGRNLKGLCPFHSEKTPSFVVSPEKQICYCFGCHKGGDIFAFIQELESVSFPEALKILGEKAGVKVDTSKFDKKTSKSEKDIYFRAHELACDFFEKNLHDTADGKKVVEYLHKRGIEDETIKEFKIGFAPDSFDALHPYLLKKGIPKDVLYKSGLISAKNLASDKVYDKYRGRLMFPIFDYFGKVCGFGGRALKKDQMPKYLNSSENIIYNKSKVLYGLSHSKQFVKEKDCVVLVEGYFDVILPYQSGVKNVVATSGTALSDAQGKMIKRLTSNVVTCFDNDSAGIEATKRSYFVLRKQDINVKTVVDMKDKDPADFVLDDKKSFFDVVESAPDFEEFFINKSVSENDINTISGRNKVLKEVLPLYTGMSPAVGDFFIRTLAKKMNIGESILYDELRNLKLRSNHPAKDFEEEKETTGNMKLSRDLIVISLLLEYPSLFGIADKNLNFEEFENDAKSVYNELTNQYNSAQGEIDEWDFESDVLAQLRDKVSFLRLYADEFYGSFAESILEGELLKLVDRMREERRIGKMKELQKEIEEAEKRGDKGRVKELLVKQMSEVNKK